MIKRILASFLASIMLVAGAGTVLPAITSAQGSGTYAALGDSVAAGAGLPPSGEGVPGCGRSFQAYPHIVADETNLTLAHIACGGAMTTAFFVGQDVGGSIVPPQLDVAFANGKPRLISMTIGANDVRWSEFLGLCITSNCATPEATAAAQAYIKILEAKLHGVFLSIQHRSFYNAPRTVITGYYNPISNACIGKQPYADPNEIMWLNDQRDALNKTIRKVASHYSFARYASTNFSGHTICSTDPWIQAPGAPAPFHPTARGQQHIAKSVLAAATQQ